MNWVELQIVIPRERVDQVSETLFSLGALGLQEDHLPGEAPPMRQPWDEGAAPPPSASVLLRAWWEEDAAGPSLEDALALALPTDQLSWQPVEEEGWADAWRDRCAPVHIADDLRIAPPWSAVEGDLVIEPGMAFGTGDHPTTRACLAAVWRHGRSGQRCLDVGTGSGVLALAAAQRGMDAWGIDIDRMSVRAALDHAALNRLQIRADTTPLSAVDGHFDLVVANLFAELVVQMADDLKRVTRSRLVVAGILADREAIVTQALLPFTLVRRELEGAWVHLEFTP